MSDRSGAHTDDTGEILGELMAAVYVSTFYLSTFYLRQRWRSWSVTKYTLGVGQQ